MITGASKLAQLRDNLGAVRRAGKLTPEVLASIDEIRPRSRSPTETRGHGLNVRVLTPADAAAFQALRLQALSEDPVAFASSYEEERDTAAGHGRRAAAAAEDRAIVGAFDGTSSSGWPPGTARRCASCAQGLRLGRVRQGRRTAGKASRAA